MQSGEAPVCFCSGSKLAILPDKPLAGWSVCLCTLSRGRTEEQWRKRPLKSGGGAKKKRNLHEKKFVRHPESQEKTVATSVLLATEVPLWRAGAGDSGKDSNAHSDRPEREALSCLQYTGLSLTWKRAMRALSLLGILCMSAR